MPELPEVETTRRGVDPHVRGKTLDELIVRDARLRWPVDVPLVRSVCGQRLQSVERRAKYLIFVFGGGGNLLLHLGMSGSLRVLTPETALRTHDHVDLRFADLCLRFNDPRRFGSLCFAPHPVEQHSLLAHLGPEPLDDAFTGDWLHARAKGRRTAIKSFLMDGRVVVGVGNIYANEALFAAGISPTRAAGRVSRARYGRLVEEVKKVLRRAIDSGGSTLRDFLRSDGSPGYFQQTLAVYGRAGEPCPNCGDPVRQCVVGQRSTFYCARCQR